MRFFDQYKKQSTLFIIFSVLVVLIFQNCSEVEFAAVPNKSHKVDILGDGTILETFSGSVPISGKVDILFVLDDSCSMGSIISNVKNGVASLQNISFPADTRFAATYMSPVKLGADGAPDFNNPYYQLALGTPGHMQLVSGDTIENYLSQNPNRSDSFPIQGCENAWFSPSQTNASGQACIEAAMQAPFMCTVVEAGITSYEQLLYKAGSQGQKLFRDGASANIVFVSDTHDPGAHFYGLEDSPDRMKTYSELLDLTMKAHPEISSFRISGIIPLPVQGDPKLDGINVIGGAPQSEQEAKINGEGTYDYHYLDYIRSSQGVAVHAKRDDWASAIGQLINVTASATGPQLFNLTKEVSSIIEVKLNGALLNPSEYTLQPDQRTLLVHVQINSVYSLVINYNEQ